VFVQLTNGRARLAGLFGRIAGDKPISLTWNSTLSSMSAFAGRDWAESVRRWSGAGGQMTVRAGSQFTAGDTLVQAHSGTLGADDDGRLRGVLDVGLREAPRALDAMAASGVLSYGSAEAARAVAGPGQAGGGQAGGAAARATIHFEAGQITLGPVALGRSPRVFTPH
jgi:hypothetical protein